MYITVVGCGNGGCALAAMLSKRGNKVTLLKTTDIINDNFSYVMNNKVIKLIKGSTESSIDVYDVTYDVEKALKNAEVVFIITQTIAHKALANKLSPYFRDGQIVVICPGYCGSIYFYNECKNKNVIFVEGESLPYDARLQEKGTVKIFFENVRNPIAAFPSIKNKEAMNTLKQILPSYIERQNILQVALHNPNLIIHTTGAILSVSRIEYSKGNFSMYKEAFTPTMIKLVNNFDGEKRNILKALGLKEETIWDTFTIETYEKMNAEPLEAFLNYAEIGAPNGPVDANTRYITEDVPMGLCFMSSLGKYLNIETPICNSLIDIASAFHNVNYWNKARTMEELGLKKYSQSELLKYLYYGEI